jgi:solute carrier family 39 (zinc transporter), member 1/2/3
MNANQDVAMSYVATILMSLHSLLAGFALGASTSVSNAFVLAVAIVGHKWVESFALVFKMLRTNQPEEGPARLSIASKSALCFYSCMTPLGIIVATVLSSAIKTSAAAWFTGISSSVAAGVFVYLGLEHFVEARKLSCRRDLLLWKLFPEAVGFTMIAAISLVV